KFISPSKSCTASFANKRFLLTETTPNYFPFRQHSKPDSLSERYPVLTMQMMPSVAYLTAPPPPNPALFFLDWLGQQWKIPSLKAMIACRHLKPKDNCKITGKPGVDTIFSGALPFSPH
ncbi:hypothetical protein AVEN_11170-1, partial [Araneus ventricosus]